MLELDEKADFRIARDGTWFHNGAPIRRESLARLFSDRALVMDEAGRYWLATPYDRYPVVVEDVPYIVVDFEETPQGVDLVTNMGERVELGPGRRLELRSDIPYVEVRDGLYARLGRPVYYNMVNKYGASVPSRGVDHPLGVSDE